MFNVHPQSRVAIDRLGHEGCGFTIGVGDVVAPRICIFLHLVSLRGQRAKIRPQFVLAGRHFVVVLVERFHCPGRFLVDSISARMVLCFRQRGYGEVSRPLSQAGGPMLPIS